MGARNRLETGTRLFLAGAALSATLGCSQPDNKQVPPLPPAVFVAATPQAEPTVPLPDATNLSGQFGDRLKGLDIGEQIKLIEQEYSRKELTQDEAEKFVLPYWGHAYLQAASSSLDIKETINSKKFNIMFDQRSRDAGGLGLDYRNGTISSILNFNMGVRKSNDLFTNQVTQKEESGISQLRNAFMQALLRVDSQPVNSKDFGRLLIESKMLDVELKNPDNMAVLGFQAFELDSQNRKIRSTQFKLFENFMLEVMAAQIDRKIGMSPVIFNPEAADYDKILNYIDFPKDELLELHRNSDILELAGKLAFISDQRKKIKSGNDRTQSIKGLQIIGAMNAFDLDLLKSYYPGIEKVLVKESRPA